MVMIHILTSGVFNRFPGPAVKPGVLHGDQSHPPPGILRMSRRDQSHRSYQVIAGERHGIQTLIGSHPPTLKGRDKKARTFPV